ncbi:hypothetical protein GSI_02963 [Ganoderma sinense ZZ0214-1]|uniref:Uncharacterized protein n=1 Tax=Ganoderma sinense ZZ0214-1 TaxID=1077348 RepID=A0A2G8SN73_9APHY|nr:hypothetical protein GSI_02963 [Ganoderma sinense ZZ0214-1]
MGDFLVIVITVLKTIYVTKNNQGLIGSTSLARTLLYSGVIYYIPLAVLNVVHMSLTVTGADQFQRTTSVVSIFMDPVTSVLACRFLLNLRKAEEGRRNTEPTAWETLQFTPGPVRTLPPFIASMGELVDFDFVNPEGSSTGGSEYLEMTHAESHVRDSANVLVGPKVETASLQTMAHHADESRIELGNMTEEVVPRIMMV